jgi:hypothetical protein
VFHSREFEPSLKIGVVSLKLGHCLHHLPISKHQPIFTEEGVRLGEDY